MKFRAFLVILAVIGISGLVVSPVQAQNPVGWWAFGSGSPNDLTGNFGTTTLYGATVTNGQLVLSAATRSYARTQKYTGPTITAKTLVSWVFIDDLNVRGGSALTLEKLPDTDLYQVFDAIVYAERQVKTWEGGSDNYNRAQNLPEQGAPETIKGALIKMVIVYESSNRITIYHNDALYAQYTVGTLQSYAAADGTDVLFGARSGLGIGYPSSRLTGRIQEARIYNSALTLDQIKLLQPIGTVSGKVEMDGIVGYASNQDVTFTFRSAGSSDIVQIVSVSPAGDFNVSRIPQAVYILHVKSAKYLAANVQIDATSGNVSDVTVFLPAGDADNSNVVDIGDFGVLVGAYGSKLSDPTSGYDARADFNGDGKVDIADFGLMLANFGVSGDM